MFVASRQFVLAALFAAVTAVTPALAQQSAPRPTFEADGTVNVPAFQLPASPLSSKEAQAAQAMRARMTAGSEQVMVADVAQARAGLERMMAPSVAAMLVAYPVDVEDTVIAGVPVKIFTPKGKAYDRRRVLINLHGGAFQTCWPACAYLESVPIAALGGYKVVSVNYRMAPEAKHPAGVQDAAAVYRELLKRYPARSTGIYGCSAGGALTGQLAAWLPANGLAQAGAIGIFGAGAVRFMAGDSAHVAARIDGSFPPPARGARRWT